MANVKEEGVTLKRSEVGLCRGCKADPVGENFKGIFNSFCTHMESQGGWWLRVDHSSDVYKEGYTRKPDKVGILLCPPCLEEHNKLTEDLFK